MQNHYSYLSLQPKRPPQAIFDQQTEEKINHVLRHILFTQHFALPLCWMMKKEHKKSC
jgi:hypothetical protein